MTPQGLRVCEVKLAQQMGQKPMAKMAFNKIMEGLTDAVAHHEGVAELSTYRVHVPEKVDVRAIRRGQGLTQEAFAMRYGLPVATVRDWEQSRREPDTGSRLYLKMVERDPDAVRRALA